MSGHSESLAETTSRCPECLQRVPDQYEAAKDGEGRVPGGDG